MSEVDEADTITKLNRILKQFMIRYRISNSIDGIQNFLRTQLNIAGLL